MQLVDTHTHLDDDAFADDLDEVIAASRERGVTRWINVGYNEERWRTTATLAERVSGMSMMLGVHPGDADDWNADLHDALLDAIRDNHPVAVGEIGIDLYWRQDNLAQQEEVFRAQLDIAADHDLPAVIHMRAADRQMRDVLDSVQRLPHIHFHSFDGDEALRDRVLQHGATIGVGGLLSRKGSESLQQWVAGVPREIVVLETDSPWLKPRGVRGRRNQPAYVTKVAQVLADLWDQDVDTVAATTTANAERIFNLPEEPS